MLAIHFYTQIIIHIKNELLLDFCPLPLLQISCICNNEASNFYMLSSMYLIIILVKLCTHMQTISILKQGIILCMHTQIPRHTYTPTYMQECFHHLLIQKNNVT